MAGPSETNTFAPGLLDSGQVLMSIRYVFYTRNFSLWAQRHPVSSGTGICSVSTQHAQVINNVTVDLTSQSGYFTHIKSRAIWNHSMSYRNNYWACAERSEKGWRDNTEPGLQIVPHAPCATEYIHTMTFDSRKSHRLGQLFAFLFHIPVTKKLALCKRC